MSSDQKIYPVHIADERGYSELPNANTAVPSQHSMHLASLQQHLKLTQQQAVTGMQFMAYPSFVGMPNQSQYSFIQPHQNYSHNYNMNMKTNTSLQASQMLDPNATFQIPTGLINSHQASMPPGVTNMVYTTSGMQVYYDPMAAIAAAAAQRTPGIHPQVGAPSQNSFLNDVVSNHSTSTPNPPPQRTFVLPQRSNWKYRDYAKDAESHEPYDESSSISGKDHSFPVKLHRILSDPEFQEYICWMPHGRSWKILKQDEFEEKVIPLFFRHGKFSSFMRQVNGWGFRRMPAGPEKNSYYHEMFLRGFLYLSAKMRRPVVKIRSTSNTKAHPNFNDSKLFVALPKELAVITSGATSNNDTDSNTGSDSNDSGSGCTSGFETDTTTNDGSGSDQGIGVNMSSLYAGISSGSPNQMDLYCSSGGIDQGGNLYGGSYEGNNMLSSGGLDQGSNHYCSESGSNGEPNGLSDANNESNSSDGTGSDNGTTSDASSLFNPRSRSKAVESASDYDHQQMVYRRLVREAQLNPTRSMPRR